MYMWNPPSYPNVREQSCLEVEKLLGTLPLELFMPSISVQIKAGAHSLPSSELKHLLQEVRGGSYPVLDFHLWLLEDLKVPDSRLRRDLEKNLLSYSILQVFIFFIHSIGFKFGRAYGKDFFLFSNLLMNHADGILAATEGVQPKIFEFSRKFWGEYSNEWLVSQSIQKWDLPLSDLRFLQIGHKWSPVKIAPLAAALAFEKHEALEDLLAVLDRLNSVIQIREEVIDLKKDGLKGILTYPIARALKAIGIAPSPQFEMDTVFGSLLLTKAIPDLVQECMSVAEDCELRLQGLSLPSFASYARQLKGQLLSLADLYNVNASSKKDSEESLTPWEFIYDPQPKLDAAIAQAERFLLSDTSFRESWEVHRWGLFGCPELSSSIFHSALILDNLAASGTKRTDLIADTILRYQKNNHQYFDQPNPLPPDIDTLGILLRILRQASAPPELLQRFEQPLQWLERHALGDGTLPTHFCLDRPGYLTRLGVNRCAVVSANLLLGLIGLDTSRFRPLVLRSAAKLFRQVAESGMNCVKQYAHSFGIWILLELKQALWEKEWAEPIREAMFAAEKALLEQFELATAKADLKCLDAAFLILIQSQHQQKPYEARWLETILGKQYTDGSWDAEPFYVMPAMDHLQDWYRSRTMTTSFCHLALKTRAQFIAFAGSSSDIS